MSDSNQGGNNSGETPPADGFKPIESQEELNRLLGDRAKREREKFSNYEDLQAKAARLDEIEKANQTELEKATNARAQVEKDRDTARAEALRLRTAVAHGISLEDADLFLTGNDEETLTAQAKRLSDREADRKKHGNHVPREGATHQSATDDPMREFARGLFGREE